MRKLVNNEKGNIFGARGDLTNYPDVGIQYPLSLQMFICVTIVHSMWVSTMCQVLFEYLGNTVQR